MAIARSGRPHPVTGAWMAGQPTGSRRFHTFTRPIALDGGTTMSGVTMAYETWGRLDADASNAVLVCHALTGDSHAAGPVGHGHPAPGWWDDLIGPGRPLDPVLHVALLGDIEAPAARAVLTALRRAPQPPAATDVLKVAHHGSANRDDALLDALAAPLAIICVGAGNDYGHPAPSTLMALQRRGFRVLRTDLDGDVAVARGDPGLLVATRGPG